MTIALNAITCEECRERIEFDDDGTTQCMPDGYLIGGEWFCDECGQELGLK